MEVEFIIKKVEFLYEREGILGPFRALGRKIYHYGFEVPSHFFSYVWTKVIRRKKFPTFSFLGNTYRYSCGYRNFAWMTERTVEIPIATQYLAEAYEKKKRILEIGDTLRQYTGFDKHDIVDKYEYRKGIINIDIEDFKPKDRYDFIVSVSTMEHVGWDAPDVRDPEKLQRVLRIFKESFLAPGGMVLITMPIGHNSALDKYLHDHSLPFSKTYFMKRISKQDEWEEATEADALSKKYGSPFPAANAIVIGIIEVE